MKVKDKASTKCGELCALFSSFSFLLLFSSSSIILVAHCLKTNLYQARLYALDLSRTHVDWLIVSIFVILSIWMSREADWTSELRGFLFLLLTGAQKPCNNIRMSPGLWMLQSHCVNSSLRTITSSGLLKAHWCFGECDAHKKCVKLPALGCIHSEIQYILFHTWINYLRLMISEQ